MSSKHKRKSPFNAPSQVTEKYIDSLNRAKADETSPVSEAQNSANAISGTDAPLGDAIATPQVIIRQWQIPKWLEKILKTVGYIAAVVAVVGLLIGVVLFFYDMNSSVRKTNEDIGTLNTKVEKVESRVETLSDETRKEQGQIQLKMVELKSMIDRVLDNLLPSRNNNRISAE